MNRTQAVLFALLLSGAAACGKAPEKEQAPSSSANDITLPAAQQARVRTQPIQPTNFSGTVQTTGTVAFDGDISTAVLAPISGPVTRIVVQPGAQVTKGQ